MASVIAAGITTTTSLVHTGDTSGVLQFQTNGTTAALTIDTSQRVGIGTPSPSASLDVQSPNASNSIRLTATTGTNGAYQTFNNTGNTLYVGTDNSAGSALGFGAYAAGMYSSTKIVFQSASASNSLTLDTSGNLGLGVTPSAWGQSGTLQALQIKSTSLAGSGTNAYWGSNWYGGGFDKYISGGTVTASLLVQTGGAFNFYTAGAASSHSAGDAISFTQSMTLDNSGNLLVNQTSSGVVNINGISLNGSSGGQAINHISGTGSGSVYMYYGYNGTTIGSITQSGTTAVLYNTTSDYRLKSNVQPVTTGLSIVNQLNPVNFTWVADNEADTGFLAHEFQAVIPRAVTGEKDATKTEEYEVTPAVKDENGNVTTPAVMGTRTVPVYQQMDNSGAVPYLVAAIKELSAKVTALEAKVA
jgi:hypothetical protein